MRAEFFMKLMIILVALVMSGCSNNNSTPIVPNTDNPLIDSSEHRSRVLIGAWNVQFDLNNLGSEITLDRDLASHFNVTQFLSTPYIQVNSYDPVTEIVNLDLSIVNQYHVNAYDVRLIIFTDNTGHKLLNADSWTALYDIPGGLPINPFKAFNRQISQRLFPGESLSRETLEIRLPDGNPNVRFVIDASYPSNCTEPYEISEFEMQTLGDWQDAYSRATVKVKSWSSPVNYVGLYCPQLNGSNLIDFMDIGDDYFSAYLINIYALTQGKYIGYFVASTEDSSSMKLYDEVEIDVTDAERWARTWGGFQGDYATSVAVDSDNNSYVAGFYFGDTDFDPGPETHFYQVNGMQDIYLVKFDSDGMYQWARTWGSNFDDGMEQATCVLWDKQDGVYVLGYFTGACYFDRYSESDLHTSNGGQDNFLTKFDIDGNYEWTITWGSSDNNDLAYQMEFDSVGNLYVTGVFSGTVDFDPGAGEEIRTVNGEKDIFLSKYDHEGNFQWVLTWGGSKTDYAFGLDVDLINNVYVTGYFNNTVDFNTGTGEDFRTALGDGLSDRDSYVSKFSSQGIYQWAMTSGGIHKSEGSAIHCLSSQRIFVSGDFTAPVDFDPGPLVDERTSDGVFISRFDLNGNYYWTRSWGAKTVNGVEHDMYGRVYVYGEFKNSVDFDPTIYEDIRIAYSFLQPYISVYDVDGNYSDVITFGGMYDDFVKKVIAAPDGKLRVCGGFGDKVDFDITSGEDIQISSGIMDSYLTKIVY